jgi:L-lactate dehydrogenase (cytochrome)
VGLEIWRFQARDSKQEIPIFSQHHVDKQMEKTEKLLGHVDELGVGAIFVTVDAPVLGKRRKSIMS